MCGTGEDERRPCRGEAGRVAPSRRAVARPAVRHGLLPLAGLLAAAVSGAGEVPEAPPGPLTVYRIAAGDTISIIVHKRPDLSLNVRVPPEGTVVLPGTGAVRVAGRGLEELSLELAERLEADERLIDPRVVVSIVSYGSRRAFIYGAVACAQAVDLPAEAPLTLMQALASLGGLSPHADRAAIRITRRRQGEPPRGIVFDAREVARGELPESDLVLEPGDTVFVPRREPVYVLGQVTKQGAIEVPYEYPLTASKAVALSGGFTAFARHGRVIVTRRAADGVKRFTADVGSVLAGGDLEQDIELLPGDTVYVPARVF